MGETLKGSIQAQMLFAKCRSEQIAALVEDQYIYLVCGMMILLVGAVVQVPSLITLHKASTFLSYSVQYHSGKVFKMQKKRVVDRLNERYGQNMDKGIDNSYHGRRAFLRLYHPGLLLGGTTGGFIVGVVVFYLLFYFIPLLELGSIIEQLPLLMNQEASRNLAIAAAYVYALESYNTGKLFALIPDYSLQAAPIIDFNATMEKFQTASTYIQTHNFKMSSEHFQELYQTSTVDNDYMRYGWKAGIRQYFEDTAECVYSGCDNYLFLYNLQNGVANKSTEMVSFFSTDIRVAASAKLGVVIGLLTGCSVVMVLVLVLVILPVNQVMYRQTKVLWKICSILPPTQLPTKLRDVTK